jgi:hypothetical protein
MGSCPNQQVASLQLTLPADECFRDAIIGKLEALSSTSSSTGSRRKIRKADGPDAKALACALKVATQIGLDAIAEDDVTDCCSEVDLFRSVNQLLTTESDCADQFPETGHQVIERESAPEFLSSDISCGATLSPIKKKCQYQAIPPNSSCMPTSPLVDHEPSPEEDDEDGLPLQERSTEDRAIPTMSPSDIPAIHPREPALSQWNLDTEETGDGAAKLKDSVSPDFNTGLGLSPMSGAIWVEVSDAVRPQLTSPIPILPTATAPSSVFQIHIDRGSHDFAEDLVALWREKRSTDTGILGPEVTLTGNEDSWVDINESTSKRPPSSDVPDVTDAIIASQSVPAIMTSAQI